MKLTFILLILAGSLSFTACDNSSGNSTVTAPDPVNEGSGSEEAVPAPLPAPNPNPNMPLEPGQWAADQVTMIVEANLVKLQFACSLGRIPGNIRPDENGRFAANGTISFFSNETGAHESYDARFEGIASPDKSIIAIRMIADDPRIEGGTQNEDFIVRKGFVPPERACAL